MVRWELEDPAQELLYFQNSSDQAFVEETYGSSTGVHPAWQPVPQKSEVVPQKPNGEQQTLRGQLNWPAGAYSSENLVLGCEYWGERATATFCYSFAGTRAVTRSTEGRAKTAGAVDRTAAFSTVLSI